MIFETDSLEFDTAATDVPCMKPCRLLGFVIAKIKKPKGQIEFGSLFVTKTAW